MQILKACLLPYKYSLYICFDDQRCDVIFSPAWYFKVKKVQNNSLKQATHMTLMHDDMHCKKCKHLHQKKQKHRC